MQVVIDANILISLLISPGKPIDLFLREELEVFAPELLMIEVERNMPIIMGKTKHSATEIEKIFLIIKKKTTIIPGEEFLHQREEAIRVCPDHKDVTYFALAMHLKCAVWSNEKQLKNQERIPVYATHELIRIFEDL